jgi:hypothetical protein
MPLTFEDVKQWFPQTDIELREAEIYIAGHREREECLTCGRLAVKNSTGWGHIYKPLNKHRVKLLSQLSKEQKIKALEAQLERLKAE